MTVMKNDPGLFVWGNLFAGAGKNNYSNKYPYWTSPWPGVTNSNSNCFESMAYDIDMTNIYVGYNQYFECTDGHLAVSSMNNHKITGQIIGNKLLQTSSMSINSPFIVYNPSVSNRVRQFEGL